MPYSHIINTIKEYTMNKTEKKVKGLLKKVRNDEYSTRIGYSGYWNNILSQLARNKK